MDKNVFPHIEDYLEILAGRRCTDGSMISLFGLYESPINLARYDIKMVCSLADQVSRGLGLTDKQSELVLRLVSKYQRQLSSEGVDATDIINSPTYRIPVRTIDRSRYLYLDGSTLIFRFPYDADLIAAIKKVMTTSQGACRWNNNNRVWQMSLTEWNLSWAHTFASQNQFDIDPTVTNLMQSVLESEKTPYRIELGFRDGELAILNAAPSLLEYLDHTLGGVKSENLLALIDNAPILGYTISDEIKAVVAGEFDSTIFSLFTSRLTHVQRLDPTDDGRQLLDLMIRYATLSNRWPICIYEPDASDRLRNTMKSRFKPDEIIDTAAQKSNQPLDFSKKKFVYFNKLSRNMISTRVPLFLSTNAMLFGPDKQAVVQMSDKIVYYTATTYDKPVSNLICQ